jgi:tetratricopeptide (TPR) repeat protein
MPAQNSFFKVIMILSIALISSFLLSGSVESDHSWDIHLNTESIEQILLHPEKILADPDHFWKTDKAYIFVDSWHKSTKISKTRGDYYNKWLGFLKEQSRIPVEERKNNEAFQFLETLKKKMSVYIEKGVPHIKEFLPDNGLFFKAGIYLTTRTMPYAFMSEGNMVLDPLSYKYKMDADAVFNSLIHEAFHIGYGYNRYLRREHPLANEFHYNVLLDSLQNEGMAVYLAWRASSFFPAPKDRDYMLLEDMSEVKKRFKWVNEIFAAAGKDELSPEELREKAWDLGVEKRAYYITGAHMSRCIDQKLGREALVGTVADGPLSFIDRYNEIAEPGMKVYRFERPDNPPMIYKLKLAVLDEDNEKFEQVAHQLKESEDSLEEASNLLLGRIGRGQMYVKKWDWAFRVSRLQTDLFPESVYSWYGLATAYMESEDLKSAKMYFKKVLEMDPEFHYAERMLERIRKSEEGKD